jgi:hypothetical protein
MSEGIKAPDRIWVAPMEYDDLAGTANAYSIEWDREDILTEYIRFDAAMHWISILKKAPKSCPDKGKSYRSVDVLLTDGDWWCVGFLNYNDKLWYEAEDSVPVGYSPSECKPTHFVYVHLPDSD